jgi:hypothetical protein
MRLRYAYTALGPAGAWWLRPRFEGAVRPQLGRTLISASAGDDGVRVRLHSAAGFEEVQAAHVLAGTGYRPAIERLEFLDGAIRESVAVVAGTPVLDASFQSSEPGLYFVGYPAGMTFGPLMRFVFGADFAARRVAGQLRAA